MNQDDNKFQITWYNFRNICCGLVALTISIMSFLQLIISNNSILPPIIIFALFCFGAGLSISSAGYTWEMNKTKET